MDEAVTVFTFSDSTGETAETVARAAISQFEAPRVRLERLPRVVDADQLVRMVEVIAERRPCLIAYTFVVPEFNDTLEQEASRLGIPTVDLLGPLIHHLSASLGAPPRRKSGLLHALDAEYYRRMEAIEFAIKFDDGKDPRGVLAADVVLTGVSRTSKTPTCMYLAQNKGIRAGNVPLVINLPPPAELFQLGPGRVVGLTIDPTLLYEIRTARLQSLGLPKTSEYAQFDYISRELDYAADTFKKLGCPIVDVSHKAIEETASEILWLMQAKR